MINPKHLETFNSYLKSEEGPATDNMPIDFSSQTQTLVQSNYICHIR